MSLQINRYAHLGLRFGDPRQSGLNKSVTGWSEQHRHRAQRNTRTRSTDDHCSGWGRQNAL